MMFPFCLIVGDLMLFNVYAGFMSLCLKTVFVYGELIFFVFSVTSCFPQSLIFRVNL